MYIIAVSDGQETDDKVLEEIKTINDSVSLPLTVDLDILAKHVGNDIKLQNKWEEAVIFHEVMMLQGVKQLWPATWRHVV